MASRPINTAPMEHRAIARCLVGIVLVAALIALDTRAETSGDAPPSDGVAERANTRDSPPTATAPLAFRTKYAHFQPAEFSELPGWDADPLAQSWSAFRQSCNALARRSAWSGPCARSAGVDGSDDRKVRTFLEREFVLFQITDLQLTPTGVVTGYYEPLLNGRRERGGNFIFPIYATPDDLLFLDSRAIAANRRSFDAVIEGRAVIPVGRDGGADPRPRYRVELGAAVADIRDKRMRLRIDGERIVPYYTRGEIDERGLASARVLAWVDDPATLYAMHVQGAGRIRFEDGSVMRVAYGEQNGHPFLPPAQLPGDKGTGYVKAPLARGLILDREVADDPGGEISIATGPAPRATTRGIAPIAGRDDALSNPSQPSKPDPQAEAVERMVELLMGEAPPPPSPPGSLATAARPSSPGTKAVSNPIPANTATANTATTNAATSNAASANVAMTSAPATRPPVASIATAVDGSRPDRMASSSANTAIKTNSGAASAWYARDPSFVFFRVLPNYEGGPVGALGVPLTPQRSVAVDPRTTPLGSPVFIAADGGTTGRWSRLVFAQDTGGAIRGPVRADFFWGFGSEAARRAGQMKQAGQMWLLLPKGQVVNGLSDAIATRGLGGAQASDAECVVPDADFCVE